MKSRTFLKRKNKMEQLVYKGKITSVDHYDYGDGLHIGENILSEELEELKGKQVSVRFYISDTDQPINVLKEQTIMQLSGALYADYEVHWSEITGYLWTDDELKIGNHDMIEILSNYDGKFVYLEIDVH